MGPYDGTRNRNKWSEYLLEESLLEHVWSTMRNEIAFQGFNALPTALVMYDRLEG